VPPIFLVQEGWKRIARQTALRFDSGEIQLIYLVCNDTPRVIMTVG
jgi:hypothetical protein